VRRTPIALVPRADLETWTALAASTPRPAPGATAEGILALLATRGAVFVQEMTRLLKLPAASVEEGLGSLVAQGRVTCDSFSGLRWLLLPSWRRKSAGVSAGRWSRLQSSEPSPGQADGAIPLVPAAAAEFVARRLLRRTGVIFRKTLARERVPVPWRDVARACRTLEARGEVRGGRFVTGVDGEQYALPDAVTLLRTLRRQPDKVTGTQGRVLSPFDPSDLRGVLTPAESGRSAVASLVRAG
jgi:ATP-dependent Lhr-like helicase